MAFPDLFRARWFRVRTLRKVCGNFSMILRHGENIFLKLADEQRLLNLDRRYIRAGFPPNFLIRGRFVLPLPPPIMLKTYVALIALAAVVAGDTTSSSSSTRSSSSSSQDRTTVWLTGTNALGATVVTQGIYTATFMEDPVLVSHVSEGLIGLGSLSGTVGKIREYSTKTMNGGIPLKASGSFAIMCALLAL